MQQTSFTTTITVDQTPQQVFEAINNVRDWWSGEIEGQSGAVNDEFTYQVPGVHYSKQWVTELLPGKQVKWLVTDSNLQFVGNTGEWTGTTILFDISSLDGKTVLQFTHVGLQPELACYNGCSGGWQQIIQQSLQSLITTGKGVKIF